MLDLSRLTRIPSPADHNKDILHILTTNGGNNSISAAQYYRFCRRNNIIEENASSFLDRQSDAPAQMPACEFHRRGKSKEIQEAIL